MKITELKINKKIITNLAELGYENLTEIQEQVTEPMLNNENVLAQAQTGSGKTAAFLVPIIHKISNDRKLKGLVIAPTRDLANQIFDNAIKYAKGVGVRCANFYGGSSYSRQIKFLEAGIDLVIGTPGRLWDLYERKKLNLAEINFLVLDEADQMLDMGFIDDIRKIVKALGKLDQISLFSATIPKEIMRFVNELMPTHVNVKVESKVNVNDMIEQTVYMVDTKNKPKLLVNILGDSNRTKQQAIVFSRTRTEAADIAKYLKSYGFKVEALHSDRSQSSRTRALRDFRDNRVQIMVATNVAARGIDINDLPLVINYNLPENKETYVHRIGRTGRIGKKGEAISFMTKNDGSMLRDIERLINMKIQIIDKPEYAIADQNAEVLIRESQIKRGSSSKRSNSSRNGSSGHNNYSKNRSSNSYRDKKGLYQSGRNDNSNDRNNESKNGKPNSSYRNNSYKDFNRNDDYKHRDVNKNNDYRSNDDNWNKYKKSSQNDSSKFKSKYAKLGSNYSNNNGDKKSYDNKINNEYKKNDRYSDKKGYDKSFSSSSKKYSSDKKYNR